MKAKEILRDPVKAFNWAKDGNAAGIITLCRSLGLTSEEAADKAREFARIAWEDKEKAVEEATRFWTSKRLSGGREQHMFVQPRQ